MFVSVPLPVGISLSLPSVDFVVTRIEFGKKCSCAVGMKKQPKKQEDFHLESLGDLSLFYPFPIGGSLGVLSCLGVLSDRRSIG